MAEQDSMTSATPPRLLVCNCQSSMEIDGARLARVLGLPEPLPVASELCRGQIGIFERALASEGGLQIACTQEAPLFREVAAEKGANEAALTFTNIRERAGWCEARADALPKMAALLAEAALPVAPTGVATLTSSGGCLVYGRGQETLDVAAQLSGRLSVTVLLADAADALPPSVVSVPIYKGRIRRASGHLGAFQIEVDGYAPMLPSSRGGLEFALARDGAQSTCDLILDMSGDTALFRDAQRRDGYVRVDPSHPAAIARGMFELAELVGEFEKPLYVDYNAGICAHARSGKVGCTNCLDACPVGAIAPDGDHVAIDSAICGGCGSCSASCPTGAAGYAFPQRADLMARLATLLKAYRAAGGSHPVVLFHDERHGSPLIAAMARLGRGLPANVLPVSLHSVLQLGHEALAATLAYGAEHAVVLAPPEAPAELATLESQAGLTTAILDALGYAGPAVHLLIARDPDAVEGVLYELPQRELAAPAAFVAVGSKREVARLALATLKDQAPAPAEVVALPQGAPYGRIHVATEGCTLCLSCVGACPAGALSDNPERPQVAFTEAACVQCGVCVATCPEKVIALEPRYNFAPAAMSPKVLKSEEPFACISCGKQFGARATVERVLARLKGHAMFQNEAQMRVIQMCETCRVVSWTEMGDDPLKGAPRPLTRTTQDYLAEEEAAAQPGTAGRKPEDFLH
jgi:ferredoxin